MLKNFKNSSKNLLLASLLALTPVVINASFIEGSSESTSAMLEDPSYEKQLVRINVGINLIRMNTDIIQNMPVSEDSEWVNQMISPVNYSKVNNLDAVKNDAYYSTVRITNALLGKRISVRMSPLEARLFWQASVIYKNPSNGNNDYNIPDMNVFPDVSDSKTYTSFNISEDEKVALIDVEAVSGNLYKNVEEAVISLLPEEMIENVTLAKDEYREAVRVVGEQNSQIAEVEAWLDDDANEDSPDEELKKQELEALEVALEEKEELKNMAEETYFTLLENGADAVEANLDISKIPLAKKLDALLEAVDNNAIGASSMFVSATGGVARGYGTISSEMQAIGQAQALTNLVGNQKEFIAQRYKRMLVGTVLAIPNITMGVYYAGVQSASVGKYQDIVETVLAAQKGSK